MKIQDLRDNVVQAEGDQLIVFYTAPDRGASSTAGVTVWNLSLIIYVYPLIVPAGQPQKAGQSHKQIKLVLKLVGLISNCNQPRVVRRYYTTLLNLKLRCLGCVRLIAIFLTCTWWRTASEIAMPPSRSSPMLFSRPTVSLVSHCATRDFRQKPT